MLNLYKFLLTRIYNPFVSTNLKPVEFIPAEGEKYLVIAPHPDDESIGCGGILTMYPEFFDVLCLTHGNDADERKQEFENAMKTAGIRSYKMLDFKDKHVISYQKEFNGLDFEKYDIIFAPYIFDQHKDHKAISLLLAEKFNNESYTKKPRIAFYEVWSAINMPNYFVDISAVVNEKSEMINCHKSQIETKDYAGKIAGLNSYRGMLRGTGSAECFSIMSFEDFRKVVSRIAFGIKADIDE